MQYKAENSAQIFKSVAVRAIGIQLPKHCEDTLYLGVKM